MEANRPTIKLLKDYPAILLEWDFEKNEAPPQTIKSGSTIYAWWKCKDCANSWKAQIYKRCVNGTSCPECAKAKRGAKKSKPKPGNSLQETFPEVAKFWDYELNAPLTPLDVTPKSNKRFWWTCDKGDGHKWSRTVGNATKSGKCPACSGRMVVKGNSLLDLHPECMKYWSTTNPENKHPSNLRPGSNARLIWECGASEDHVWELKVHDFVKGGCCCPYCEEKKPSSTYNLSLLHPEICSEWDFSKNEMSPNEMMPYSSKIAYWKCSQNSEHTWKASIASRTKIGAGCPYCAGVRVEEKNSLFHVLPDIAKQWHYKNNEGICFSDGRQLTPKNVSTGSSKKVWWKCDEGDDHVWLATIHTRRASGCPVCAGQLAVHSNCLETTRPDIAQQWNYELNDDLFFSNGKKITPRTVTEGSNKRVWWTCPKDSGHIWPAVIHTRRLHGCPICAGQLVTTQNSLSKTHPRHALQWDFELNDIIVRPNGKKIDPWSVSSGSNVKVNWICLDHEHHKWSSVISSRTKQKAVCPFCVGSKTSLENSLQSLFPKIASQWHPTKNGDIFNINGDLIQPANISPNSHFSVWWKCDMMDDHEWEMSIRQRTGSGSDCQCCNGRVAVPSNCLSTTHPELAKQWDYEKNEDLSPMDITASTTIRLHWKCDQGPDHEWDSLLSSRVRGCGCPCCSGKKVVPSNSLNSTHPELVKEWDLERNHFTPLDVTAGSGKMVWWKCDRGDDHVWDSTVANRVSGNGCPVCANKKITGSNSLFKLRPELMKEWDWLRNEISPHDLSVGSNKKVWWICEFMHSWKAPPARRSGNRANNCPDCAEYGLRPSDPCFIYLLRYSGPIGTWYKVGITSNIDRRVRELESALRKTEMFFDHHIDVEYCLDMPSARVAREFEKTILEKSNQPEFIFESFDGSTEFVAEFINLDDFVREEKSNLVKLDIVS